MSEFLVAAFLLLAAADPVGFGMASAYPVTESATPINGHRAYASWPPYRYSVQTAWFEEAYPGPYNRMALACTLAHEGAHLHFRTSNETVPLMQQYICLDRVGAPQVLKDHVYGELKRALTPAHGEN